MDEKTENLRDIFMDVSEEGTVTESQTDERGSLVGGDDERDADRLRELVESLREREAFDTGLDTETCVAVVRAFYDDADDEAIADRLDLSRETVLDARLDLHLLRDADTDAPFDLGALRQRRDADDETLATDLDVDVETVRHYRRIVAAEDAVRAANHRFQREFDQLLTDADLTGRHAGDVQEDGLDEAAEDIETDVSF